MAKGVKTGGGSRKGVPNKATQNAREAIAEFVNGNVDSLTSWLDEIAEESPKDAFNCFMSVVEYHIPKLQRTDSNTTLNGKIDHNHKVDFVGGELSNTDKV